jgi:stage III sporulation protein SpoIIIAA
MEVPTPDTQAPLIREALRNHAPQVLMVDEVMTVKVSLPSMDLELHSCIVSASGFRGFSI